MPVAVIELGTEIRILKGPFDVTPENFTAPSSEPSCTKPKAVMESPKRGEASGYEWQD